MTSPLASGPWLELDEVESTQDVLRAALASGTPPGVVFAHHQTRGRGRFERPWFSEAGRSLTMSMVFPNFADHPRPWLVGMAVAAAAAAVVHCRLRWPNDLFLDERKIGGVVTELFPDAEGRSTPVVGIGINLDIERFPAELEGIATSLAIHRPSHTDPIEVGRAIVARLDDLPEPDHWEDIRPIWTLFDDTPGKPYRLISGETSTAIGIGPEGELVCAVDGETTMVLAAEALLGREV
ncbi:MAG TPA: biotin--[acetyl-CoA-carboxylase] ligase [Fimbriimonadaceae bacterium]|nr:biotin--[acetyl-CoA-carboxylase] ligase [Fimbriimonadaceae bacterium]HRJ96630.1 biotin--[acetyl-CoA-carboxylase] ligase [Fimbriimonadaceae bacterium]